MQNTMLKLKSKARWCINYTVILLWCYKRGDRIAIAHRFAKVEANFIVGR